MPRKSTRGAQGAGTIRQRSDGRWEARYTVGRDPGTGKQVQRSIYGATQQEVRKKLQEAVSNIDKGIFTESTSFTVSQWLNTWLKEYNGNVKITTAAKYQQAVEKHIIPALGAVKLTALRAHQVQAFYNDLQHGTKDAAPLSPKTIKNIHGILHKALEQACRLSYIHINPASGANLPRIEKPAINPLDDREIAAFLKAIQGTPDEILLSVDLFTGMRQSEIIGLTWDCIDFENGSITIRRQLIRRPGKGNGFMFSTLKNDKSRTITPAPFIMQLLKRQKIEQAKKKLIAGTLWDTEFPDLVFTNDLGVHVNHNTIAKHYKKALSAAGISERRFHDLRHSYAVAALRSGDDVKTVQETLGHHSAAFTLDQYGHVTEQMKRESAQRMEKYIKTVTGN